MTELLWVPASIACPRVDFTAHSPAAFGLSTTKNGFTDKATKAAAESSVMIGSVLPYRSYVDEKSREHGGWLTVAVHAEDKSALINSTTPAIVRQSVDTPGPLNVSKPFHPWLIVLAGLAMVALGGYMLLLRLSASISDHAHTGQDAHRHWFRGKLTLVHTLQLAARFNIGGQFTKRWLPIVSGTLIMVLGGAIAYQGLSAANLHLSFHLHSLTREKLGPLLYVIGLGLVLGMRHSTDADHVVAISTIVSKQRSIRAAAFIGSVWGIGHTITIFIVGSLIILFGIEIPPRLGLSMEFCVAIMLVLLGILNLTGVVGRITQRYTRGEAATVSMTASKPYQATFSEHVLNRTVGRFGMFHFMRPLVIGLVHGLAGSAAVALLVLSTIHNPVWATFYLLIFGAGTMVGMMCMTAAIAIPFTYVGDRFVRISRYLNYASGMASLCFGSFLVYQLGYLGNLFGSHPLWTPR